MRPITRAARCLLALVTITAPASAQRVGGTVVSDESGVPVRGAIVSVYAGNDTAAVTLTGANGAFQLALSARRELTLLVRAIGLQPARILLRAGIDTVVTVRMTRIAFRLATVSVNEFTSCAKTQTGTVNIVDVWLEVTKALENTLLVRGSKKRTFGYNLYEQLTDSLTGRARFLKNDTSSWVAMRPFKVTPPKELAKKGYVIEDPYVIRRPNSSAPPSLLYRAPDEMVLLDESFQMSHCFWASHGDAVNQGLIGVHFIPVSGIKINDIRGIFWIDASTYELKRLDYIYTQVTPLPKPPRNAAAVDPSAIDSSAKADSSRGVAPSLANPEPGGVLEFGRLEDGSFIIPNWRIFVNDTWIALALDGQPLRKPRLMKETGGRVLSVSGG